MNCSSSHLDVENSRNRLYLRQLKIVLTMTIALFQSNRRYPLNKVQLIQTSPLPITVKSDNDWRFLCPEIEIMYKQCE